MSTREGSDAPDLSDDEIDAIVTRGLDELDADTEGAGDVSGGHVKVLECPECSKSDLSYVAGMETGRKYQCPHCGYIGALAVERYRTPAELRKIHGMDEPAGTS